jgi:hypothetical protein
MNHSGYLKSALNFFKIIPAAADREAAVFEKFEEYNAQYISVEALKDRFHIVSFVNKFYVIAQILNVKNAKEGGMTATTDYATRVRLGWNVDHKGGNFGRAKHIPYDRMVVFRYALWL